MGKLETIIANVTGLKSEEITEELGVDNCQKWDSMAQVKMVVELEEGFNISFTTDEAMNLDNVASIRRIIKAKGVEV